MLRQNNDMKGSQCIHIPLPYPPLPTKKKILFLSGPISEPIISSGISSLPSSLQGTLSRDAKPNGSTSVVGGSLAGKLDLSCMPY